MRFKPDEIIGNNMTWPDLVTQVRDLTKVPNPGNEWIFRALGKWDGDGLDTRITSSFDEAWERPSPPKADSSQRKLYERWMLLDFKREAHNYLTHLPKPKDLLEWLALARHYEMPSRLLDFTYSFYVAAYFALSTRGRRFHGAERRDEDACIFACNLTWMKNQVEHKLKSQWCKKYKVSKTEASFHNPSLFKKFAFDSEEQYVVPVNPLRRNPRLAKQHGLFLCPGNIQEEFDTNLTKTLRETASVKRLIRVGPAVRSEALRDLAGMNINMATLYPDLTGWAQSRRDLVHRDIGEDKRFLQELENSIEKSWI